MNKFIGLKRTCRCTNVPEDMETSVIVNINDIAYLEVETQEVCFKSGKIITLNRNSTKFLLEILMENEYKLQGEEE